MGALGRVLGQGHQVLALDAALAGLVSDVDFQQDVLGDAHLGRLLLHGVHEADRVDGLDHIHLAHHKLHLVGLQVPDEVDPGPLVGIVLQVGGEFLDPVLPADGDAGPDGVADGVRGLHLGGGHQGDVLRVPASGQGGLAHVLPHSGHVGGDGLVTLCLCHSINVPPFHHIVPRKPR